MQKQISVAIVDDHLMFRLGLRSALNMAEDIRIVGEAANHREAAELLNEVKPDVMILDLRMPDGGGIALLRDVKSEELSTRFLILSSYASEEEIFQALNLGASGYVTKDIESSELMQAIRRIDAGQRYLPVHIEAMHRTRIATRSLTPRELEVLRLIVRGLTNKEIAGVLGTSINTIRNQVSNIFGKLEVADRAESVAVAIQRGLVLPSD